MKKYRRERNKVEEVFYATCAAQRNRGHEIVMMVQTLQAEKRYMGRHLDQWQKRVSAEDRQSGKASCSLKPPRHT